MLALVRRLILRVRRAAQDLDEGRIESVRDDLSELLKILRLLEARLKGNRLK